MAATNVIQIVTPSDVDGDNIAEVLGNLVEVLGKFLAGPFTGSIDVDPENAGHYGPISRTDNTGEALITVELNPPVEP